MFDAVVAGQAWHWVDPVAGAALAEYLARRDGWQPPSWAFDERRYAEPWWFVSGVRAWHAIAAVRP